MRGLVALVRTNLKIQFSLIFGEEEQKAKKIFSIIFFVVLCEISIGFSIFKAFNILHLNNKETLIFNLIINTELVIIIGNCFMRIINDFYSASDWKEIMVYPIKPGSLLVSKCISIYFLNILIAIFTLIPLIAYGVLSNANMYYYACIVVYQILIPAMPIGYIALTSLTILWLIAIIKKSRAENRINKFILLIDILVIVLTYILLKPALSNNIKVDKLIFSIFFSENSTFLISTVSKQIIVNFIISIAIIILVFLGVYLIGGNVYTSIMKSEILSSRSSKKIEKDTSVYEFSIKGIIVSNIIRDIKIIVRTPSLLMKCIGGSVAYSVILLIILLPLRRTVRASFDNATLNSTFVIIWILLSTAVNFTAITSFSREGRGLTQFKVFPIYNRAFLLSKIYVGLLSNLLNFIVANVFMVIIAANFTDFILLEIITISYILLIVLTQIRMDSNNLHLKWVEIKDLFQIEYILKNFIPLVIITIFIYAYLITTLLIANIERGEMLDCLTLTIFMLIAVIGSFINLRKIKFNMK